GAARRFAIPGGSGSGGRVSAAVRDILRQGRVGAGIGGYGPAIEPASVDVPGGGGAGRGLLHRDSVDREAGCGGAGHRSERAERGGGSRSIGNDSRGRDERFISPDGNTRGSG